MVTSAAEISEPGCAEHLDNFQSQDSICKIENSTDTVSSNPITCNCWCDWNCWSLQASIIIIADDVAIKFQHVDVQAWLSPHAVFQGRKVKILWEPIE